MPTHRQLHCADGQPHSPHSVDRGPLGGFDCPGEPPDWKLAPPVALPQPPFNDHIIPPIWSDTSEDDYLTALTARQQVRSEALRAASGLYLAHADDAFGMDIVATAVLHQARRFATYIETGE